MSPGFEAENSDVMNVKSMKYRTVADLGEILVECECKYMLLCFPKTGFM